MSINRYRRARFTSIVSLWLTLLRISTYCFVLEPVSLYIIVLEPISTYCFVLEPVSLYLFVLEPISTYCFVLEPVSLYLFVLEPISTYCFVLGPVSIYRYSFNIAKGLCQWCCISPTIFNIYIRKVLEEWKCKLSLMGSPLENTALHTF
jgi:hypothetical protein